jgi:hypothetical protein
VKVGGDWIFQHWAESGRQMIIRVRFNENANVIDIHKRLLARFPITLAVFELPEAGVSS